MIKMTLAAALAAICMLVSGADARVVTRDGKRVDCGDGSRCEAEWRGQRGLVRRAAKRPSVERIAAQMPWGADLAGYADGVATVAGEAIVTPLTVIQYLIETATVGGTMGRQGPEVALGRLHPEFARRLSAAIYEARGAGLPSAGVFSGYRPPAFGVGGFHDKFNSMHSYGMAADMAGIGSPNSEEWRLFVRIAKRHKIYNPYIDARGRLTNWHEWNHFQPTYVKKVAASNKLRKTITGRGPVTLEKMWRVASAMIDKRETPAQRQPRASHARTKHKAHHRRHYT
jgi:hypothetical protein